MNKEQIEATRKEVRKRPILVWLITIFYLLSAGWALFSFALINSGALPINEAERVYFDSLNIFDTILTLSMGSLNVLGAVLLFLLKRHAYHCFATAFSIGLLMTIYHILFKNWIGVIGVPGLLGAFIGWIIGISVILYSNKLIKREILI